MALPSLTGSDRAAAQRILARPTDGNNDPQGDGYTVRAKKKCSPKICVHWVRSTGDKAAAVGRHHLNVMKRVWRKEVGAMGTDARSRTAGSAARAVSSTST